MSLLQIVNRPVENRVSLTVYLTWSYMCISEDTTSYLTDTVIKGPILSYFLYTLSLYK